MTRPRITCHMVTSLDGRLHPERWSDPAEGTIDDLIGRHYDTTAERLEADGWIVGRKTMAAYVPEIEALALLDEPQPREPHVTERKGRQLAIALDPSGRLGFESGELEGEQVIAILSERVSDATLDRLRAAGVAYVFAGGDGRDLEAALETIAERFAATRLILEGGGVTNGAFLAAGLIDETSTLICPAIDGLAGIAAIYDHPGETGSHPAGGQHLRLSACEVLDGGVVWLRHEIVRK
ncbi:RibD family protein [Jiella marina]|uniref:RibD family protein n=1 Tax=Jiella sp. LLJ827 TaxID=2917712 RepID=UPI0021007767|nr:dihydrofolate reductase family protein [Jiella sp. LLJ827]MCQ0986952.1 dihydrofolate reductase family protein [Jiella sp. LLJ827]